MNDQLLELVKGAKELQTAHGDGLPICFYFFDSPVAPGEPHDEENETIYAYAVMRNPSNEMDLLQSFTELASVTKVAPRVAKLVVVMDISYRDNSPFFEMIPTANQPDYAMGLIFQAIHKNDTEEWLWPYHIDDDGHVIFDEMVSLDNFVPETETRETMRAMSELIQTVWNQDDTPFPLDQMELFHVLNKNGHVIERRPIGEPCPNCGETH